MSRRVRVCLSAGALLVALCALAGCAGHFFSGEREAWRHDAEVQCLGAGAVHEGPGKVRISPIEGPGMCGADFPLKISSLGNGAPLGFGDEPRPPSGIPGVAQPNWPIAQPQSSPQPNASVSRGDLGPPSGPYEDPYSPPVPRRYPPGYDYGAARAQQPLSIDPPIDPNGAPRPYDFRRPYGQAARPAGDPAYDLSPEPYERREGIEGARVAPRNDLPALGPTRGSPVMAAAGPVSVSPAATLACPLVSMLDKWIDDAVQPAAQKWFGQPVTEIKQISAYSCRGMNGDPNATISEHAFGNALDIAAFILADGRKVTVQYGWHGTPEEQAFLHDVQAAACDDFTTVLAPGYNAYHYNHIHVDLMRRRSGHRACQPHPISGDEIASRSRGSFAAKRGDPAVTGSIGPHHAAVKRMPSDSFSDQRSTRDVPDAVPGADGEN